MPQPSRHVTEVSLTVHVDARFRPSNACASSEGLTHAASPANWARCFRREALYSSHLVDWRRQRERGALEALNLRRGREAKHPAEVQSEGPRREVAPLRAELATARMDIDVQ